MRNGAEIMVADLELLKEGKGVEREGIRDGCLDFGLEHFMIHHLKANQRLFGKKSHKSPKNCIEHEWLEHKF